MEEAVRHLVSRGFRKRRIRIHQTDDRGRTVPEGGRAMRVGGVVGATLGLLAMLGTLFALPVQTSFWAVGLRTLGALAGGALTGGLAGLVIDAIRHRDARPESGGSMDWEVIVEAPRERVRDAIALLRDHGGDPSPA